jgi:DNA-binding NtrC family response regulator/predicted hydrocarbon binding protein
MSDSNGWSRTAAAEPCPVARSREVAAGDVTSIFEALKFFPEDGAIRLGGQRLVLASAAMVGDLRSAVVAALGEEGARALFRGLGRAWGRRDVEALAPGVRAGRLEDACAVGFARIARLGLFHPRLTALDFRGPGESPRMEARWTESIEVDALLRAGRLSGQAVCWSQLGYLEGFIGGLVGRPMAFAEVACRAMGAETCRAVGGVAGAEDGAGPALATPRPAEGGGTGDGGLVGLSTPFIRARDLLIKVARADTTVLFLGETGVGKEVFARRLHAASPRADRPFVAVNCAAIPDALIEAELFGVEKGAFTGAHMSRPGRFERADGGTLFLDEVGTLGLGAQGKLLRVLQEGEVERVGDIRPRIVNTRVVAATNLDLRQAVRDGAFREDLWYRLSPFPIRVPALRDRREDIPPLVEHFLDKYARRLGRAPMGVTERAMDALFLHPFPGNIRELENRLERAVILVPDGAPIDLPHLFEEEEEPRGLVWTLGKGRRLNRPDGPEVGAEGDGVSLEPTLDLDDRLVAEAVAREIPLHEIEARMIRLAVARAGGNLSEAARHLGMTRPQLAYRYRKIQEGGGATPPAGP